MKILLTGANGFLGKYINDYFVDKKNKVIKIGKSNRNDILSDLSIDIPNLQNDQFSIVVHVAGKAHFLPKNKLQEKVFYDVNVLGTKNLLTSIDNLSIKPKAFVFISTVAVYGLSNGININENMPLNAKDAYGHSKILAEKMVENWCEENDVICTILRLPLVIGINPLGNLKSMIEGIKKGYYVNIGGGKARKSMVLAKDIAGFIYTVNSIGGIYNITDGYHPNFFDLSTLIALKTKSRIPKNIPLKIAFVIAKIGDLFGENFPFNTNKFLKITSNLTFNDSKARSVGWKSTPVLEDFNVL
jgi:nucleoside-diphosphate-sugar epimerase